MTAESALTAGAAYLVAILVAALASRHADPRWKRENWRGRPVPAVLGLVLAVAVSVGYAVAAGSVKDRTPGVLVFAMYGLLVVGLVDDVRGGRERGFRGHLASLARLRPTTGVLKLIVGIAIAIGLAVRFDGSTLRVVASAMVIALSINVTNALDVRPGRALKWALPLLVVGWVATGGGGPGIVLASTAGGAAGVLWFDLTEQGMLGDAGSNPLGLVCGVALALALPTWGVVAAAVALLALQVVAETITISRLIDTAPPVRWLDRLGRPA